MRVKTRTKTRHLKTVSNENYQQYKNVIQATDITPFSAKYGKS